MVGTLTGQRQKKREFPPFNQTVFPFMNFTKGTLPLVKLKFFFNEITSLEPTLLEWKLIATKLNEDEDEDGIHLLIETSVKCAEKIKSTLAESEDCDYQALSLLIVTEDYLLSSNILLDEAHDKVIQQMKKKIEGILHNIGRYKHYLAHPGTQHTCIGHGDVSPEPQKLSSSNDEAKSQDDSDSTKHKQKCRSQMDATAEIADAIGGGLAVMVIITRIALWLNQHKGSTHYLLDPDVTKLDFSITGLIAGATLLAPTVLADYRVHKIQNRISTQASMLEGELDKLEEKLKCYLNSSNNTETLTVPELYINIEGKEISVEFDQTRSFKDMEDTLTRSAHLKILFYATLYALGHLFENMNQVMFTYADSFPLYAQYILFPLYAVLGLVVAYNAEFQLAYHILIHDLALKQGKFINTSSPIPSLVSSDSDDNPDYTHDKTPEIFVCGDTQTKSLKYKTTLNPSWQTLGLKYFSCTEDFIAILDKSIRPDVEANGKLTTEEKDAINAAITKQQTSLVSYAFLATLYQSPKVFASFTYTLEKLFYFSKDSSTFISLSAFACLFSGFAPYFMLLRRENESKQQAVANSSSSLWTASKYLILAATWIMYRLALASSRSANISYPIDQWVFPNDKFAQSMLSLALVTVFGWTAYTSTKTAAKQLTKSPEVLQCQDYILNTWIKSKSSVETPKKLFLKHSIHNKSEGEAVINPVANQDFVSQTPYVKMGSGTNN